MAMFAGIAGYIVSFAMGVIIGIGAMVVISYFEKR